MYLLAGTSLGGQAEWPLAVFATDSLDEVVDNLLSRGVALEAINEGPQRTNKRGIAVL